MKIITVIAMLAAIPLCACSTVPVATSKPFCRSITAVWISKDDTLTEGTATQIEGNNLARDRLCGPSKPPKREQPKTS